MARELSFKELPFEPVKRQVIYVEQSYDEKLNTFIRNNYEWLKTTFLRNGLEFCFLPLLAEETIAYNAPYLTPEELGNQTKYIPSLSNYLANKKDVLVPSLVFALDTPVKDKEGNTVLQVVPIETKWYASTKSTFRGLAKEVNSIAAIQKKKYREIEDEDDVKFSIVCEPDEKKYSFIEGSSMSRALAPEDADGQFEYESQVLIEEIKQRIKALRNRGVNTMFLHNLIDEGERLSRLRITKDFRIFLPDYDNIEIKLPDLPKSVFFLFLRHPEGIRFKELPDYYSELLQIYLKMHPNGGRSKQERSIRDVTDPSSNSINEKCARIREAFVSKFEERLAQYYFVTGKRGEAKQIKLDQSMILWDN